MDLVMDAAARAHVLFINDNSTRFQPINHHLDRRAKVRILIGLVQNKD